MKSDMLKSIASVVAGMMFVLGVAMVSLVKASPTSTVRAHLRPSVNMLLEN